MNFPHTVLNVLYSGNAVLCVIVSPAIQSPTSPPIVLARRPGGGVTELRGLGTVAFNLV
jgi:hypothetical protein